MCSASEVSLRLASAGLSPVPCQQTTTANVISSNSAFSACEKGDNEVVQQRGQVNKRKTRLPKRMRIRAGRAKTCQRVEGLQAEVHLLQQQVAQFEYGPGFDSAPEAGELSRSAEIGRLQCSEHSDAGTSQQPLLRDIQASIARLTTVVGQLQSSHLSLKHALTQTTISAANTEQWIPMRIPTEPAISNNMSAPSTLCEAGRTLALNDGTSSDADRSDCSGFGDGDEDIAYFLASLGSHGAPGEDCRPSSSDAAQANVISFNAPRSASETGGNEVEQDAQDQGWAGTTAYVISLNAAVSACEKGDHRVVPEHCAEQLSRDGHSQSDIAHANKNVISLNAAFSPLPPEMRDAGTTANVISHGAAISACENDGQSEQAVADSSLLPQQDERVGNTANVISFNAVISASEKGSRCEQALTAPHVLRDAGHIANGSALAVDDIGAPASEICFNAAISNIEKGGTKRQGARHQQADQPEDVVSFSDGFTACEKVGLAAGLEPGLPLTVISCNAATACEKGTSPCEMCDSSMPANVISSNAAISTCEKDEQWEQGLALLPKMRDVGAHAISHHAAISISNSACSRDGSPILTVISDNAAISACEKGEQWETSTPVSQPCTQDACEEGKGGTSANVICSNAAFSACEKGGIGGTLQHGAICLTSLGFFALPRVDEALHVHVLEMLASINRSSTDVPNNVCDSELDLPTGWVCNEFEYYLRCNFPSKEYDDFFAIADLAAARGLLQTCIAAYIGPISEIHHAYGISPMPWLVLQPSDV